VRRAEVIDRPLMGWLDFDYDFQVKNGCNRGLRDWRKTSLNRIRRQHR
jgi:hypothetical protein